MIIKKTLNLPSDLLQTAVSLSGATTQTMAVIMALEELIRTKRLEALLRVKGKGTSLDLKKLKKMRKR